VSAVGWLIVHVRRQDVVHTVTSAAEAIDLLFSDGLCMRAFALSRQWRRARGSGKGIVTNEVVEFAFLAAAMEAGVDFEFP